MGLFTAILFSLSIATAPALAAAPSSVLAALRIAGTLTGGSMPTNSPEFTSMANAIDSNDYYGAALTAIQSSYGANYMIRRLAFQMQNPSLDASIVKDSDATAFLMAHFLGSSGVGAPSISKIWSNNMTCSAEVIRAGVETIVKVSDLTNAEKAMIDWRNALTCTSGQQAVDAAIAPVSGTPDAKITIPAKHVGGYITLSDRIGDTSFAQNGATAGTNLRYITGLWEIATGMDINAFSSVEARPQQVPRFVPENDPNFLSGQGQTACISCHGGGLASLNHGYGTLADLFNFDMNRGLMYYSAPSTNQRKSLGSNPNTRGNTLTCNMTTFTVCNPDSVGTNVNQSWDFSQTWGARGLLATMGWQGPSTGQGLNSLGSAIGKATVVYTHLAKRIQQELCPLGAISAKDMSTIAQVGQTSDDIRQMIAQVAANPACR